MPTAVVKNAIRKTVARADREAGSAASLMFRFPRLLSPWCLRRPRSSVRPCIKWTREWQPCKNGPAFSTGPIPEGIPKKGRQTLVEIARDLVADKPHTYQITAHLLPRRVRFLSSLPTWPHALPPAAQLSASFRWCLGPFSLLESSRERCAPSGIQPLLECREVQIKCQMQRHDCQQNRGGRNFKQPADQRLRGCRFGRGCAHTSCRVHSGAAACQAPDDRSEPIRLPHAGSKPGSDLYSNNRHHINNRHHGREQCCGLCDC